MEETIRMSVVQEAIRMNVSVVNARNSLHKKTDKLVEIIGFMSRQEFAKYLELLERSE